MHHHAPVMGLTNKRKTHLPNVFTKSPKSVSVRTRHTISAQKEWEIFDWKHILCSSADKRKYLKVLRADIRYGTLCGINCYGWFDKNALSIQSFCTKASYRVTAAAVHLGIHPLNSNKTKALVVSRSRTVNPPVGDLALSGFPFALVPTLTFLAWSLTAGSHSKTTCLVLSPVSLKELLFWGLWSVSLWIPLCYFVATKHLFSQSLSILLRYGGYCRISSSASQTPGVFGGQALHWSDFLIIVSSWSCCCTVYVVQGWF